MMKPMTRTSLIIIMLSSQETERKNRVEGWIVWRLRNIYDWKNREDWMDKKAIIHSDPSSQYLARIGTLMLSMGFLYKN